MGQFWEKLMKLCMFVAKVSHVVCPGGGVFPSISRARRVSGRRGRARSDRRSHQDHTGSTTRIHGASIRVPKRAAREHQESLRNDHDASIQRELVHDLAEPDDRAGVAQGPGWG